jgi:hypothetical protein
MHISFSIGTAPINGQRTSELCVQWGYVVAGGWNLFGPGKHRCFLTQTLHTSKSCKSRNQMAISKTLNLNRSFGMIMISHIDIVVLMSDDKISRAYIIAGIRTIDKTD